MVKQKNSEMPNEKLMQDSFKAFSEMSNKMVELNRLYWDQAKSFFQEGITSSQTLYRVSTPEEFTQVFKELVSRHGELVAKGFMEKLDVILQLSKDYCDSNCCNTDDLRASIIQFYDFYAKLMPSPLDLKFDDFIKNAASGNHESLHSLHSVAEEFLGKFRSGIKQTVDGVERNIEEVVKTTKSKNN